jgi:hypothetical protein
MKHGDFHGHISLETWWFFWRYKEIVSFYLKNSKDSGDLISKKYIFFFAVVEFPCSANANFIIH